MSDLISEFHDFLLTVHVSEEGNTRETDDCKWWYSCPPFDHLINRELCPPGLNPEEPEGVLVLRTDEDFWIDAVLPWKYTGIPLNELAPLLWPAILTEGADYGNDTTWTPQPAGYSCTTARH